MHRIYRTILSHKSVSALAVRHLKKSFSSVFPYKSCYCNTVLNYMAVKHKLTGVASIDINVVEPLLLLKHTGQWSTLYDHLLSKQRAPFQALYKIKINLCCSPFLFILSLHMPQRWSDVLWYCAARLCGSTIISCIFQLMKRHAKVNSGRWLELLYMVILNPLIPLIGFFKLLYLTYRSI